jgi:hypothetical protein
VSGLLALGLVALDLGVTDGLGWIFDVGFVLVCVAAALLVRPRDFFAVGVMPPLVMAVVVAVLTATARDTVADAKDGAVQAMVSGLAHHAGALITGYVLTLGILALRQVASRNAGALRRPSSPRPVAAPAPRRPAARSHRTVPVGAAGGVTPRIPQQTRPAEEPRRTATGS